MVGVGKNKSLRPWKPKVVDPPAGIVPLYDTELKVLELTVAFQTLVTVVPFRFTTTLQAEVGAVPLLLTVTVATYPTPHDWIDMLAERDGVPVVPPLFASVVEVKVSLTPPMVRLVFTAVE